MEEFESETALGGMESGQERVIVLLPCKAHFFHEECIAEWVKKQNACPVCRQEITLDLLKS